MLGRRASVPAPPAVRRSIYLLKPALRRPLGSCSGCRGVLVACRRCASARRQMHRQCEGRLPRCARASRDPPQTVGGCCSWYWSSVGSCRWTDRPLPRVGYGGQEQSRDTVNLIAVLRMRAPRELAHARDCLYGGLGCGLACVSRGRVYRAFCVYALRTHSVSSVSSRRVMCCWEE